MEQTEWISELGCIEFMKRKILLNNEEVEVVIKHQNQDEVIFEFENETFHFYLNQMTSDGLVLESEHQLFQVHQVSDSFVLEGREIKVQSAQLARKKSAAQDHGSMKSPMPGKILKVMVQEGSVVKKGEPLLVMEAMKMEHTIKAVQDGTVEKIFFKEGQQVTGGVELVAIK